MDSIDKLPNNLLLPPIDNPQVLLACLKPSDELINGHSNAMSTDTELPPYTPSDGGFKQFENLIDILICQLEHIHKPSDTPVLTMSYSRVDRSFSFFDPLHRVEVKFERREADLIFEFARLVRQGHYPADFRLPEHYLTFARLFNGITPEARWLPLPPPFVHPELECYNNTMECFQDIALAQLERAQGIAGPFHTARPPRHFPSRHEQCSSHKGKNSTHRRGCKNNRNKQDRHTKAPETSKQHNC